MLKRILLSSFFAGSILLSTIVNVNAGYDTALPNANCSNGILTIYLQPQGSKNRFAVRIDDKTNPWNGDTVNSGDVIENNVTTSEYVYNSAKQGVEYVWWIHQVDSEGKYSDPKVGTAYCGKSKPSNLSAKYEYPNVILNWDLVPGAKYYAVRVDYTGNPWTPTDMQDGDHMRNQLSVNTLSFKAKPGKTIVWWVHSVDANGRYSEASINSFFVPATTTLSKPTGLKAVWDGSVVTISWNPVDGAKYYAVRVDDTSTPFRPEQDNLYSGDHMRNELAEPKMSFRASAGKKYVWWVHAVDYNYVYTDASIYEFYTN